LGIDKVDNVFVADMQVDRPSNTFEEWRIAVSWWSLLVNEEHESVQKSLDILVFLV
jgi:hypothetical protein